MPRLNQVILAAALIASTFAISSGSQAADNSRFDMVGLTLGMTPDAALAALRTHGVNEQSIDVSRLSYRYSDGLKHDYSTDDFIHKINAHVDEHVDGKRRTDTLNLYFSPPPKGGRLVAVRRTIENRVNPITTGQFRQAVLDKYGQPAADVSGVLNWKFGGGDRNCISNSPNGTGIPLPETSYRKSQSILDFVYHRSASQYDLNRFRAPRVSALEECASMLEYRIKAGDQYPATNVSAYLIDVRGWVNAELAAGAWVDGLRRDAVQRREGAGGKPAL
ncbi:MAG TPA: hypothetical protein VL027_02510 [Spongiibacteraceae bacterium]|nr:hypothetical protein [Spongiibacteraceae bacterium]